MSDFVLRDLQLGNQCRFLVSPRLTVQQVRIPCLDSSRVLLEDRCKQEQQAEQEQKTGLEEKSEQEDVTVVLVI